MMDNITFDLKKALTFLVEGKIVPSDVLPQSNVPFSSDLLISEINKGSELEYDPKTDELWTTTSDGSKILCPDLSEGLSESADWISNYLPEVFIDTDQGGNLRKGDEAESCFKLFAIGYILRDFKSEIEEIFKNYDYENMAPEVSSGRLSFKQHLQRFQNLNSSRINAVISAASYKLSTFREKNESFYTGQLSVEEISELSTLSRGIKAIISKYERTKGLNPNEMKDMSKISKLTLIDSRDIEIEELVQNSKVSMLYRISKLTSERIPPVIKSRILAQADKAAAEHVRAYDLKGFEASDAEQKIRRLVVKEGYRAVLKTIKFEEIEKFKKDKDSYVFKRKS